MFCKVILNSDVFQAFQSAENEKNPEKFAEKRRTYAFCKSQSDKRADNSERADENHGEKINIPLFYVDRHSRSRAGNEKRKVYPLRRKLSQPARKRQINYEKSSSADSRSRESRRKKRHDNIKYFHNFITILMPAHTTSRAKITFIVFEFSLSRRNAPNAPPKIAASI